MCPADSGANFCGDGTVGAVGTSYACSDGMVGPGTACTHGCNGATGACADLTPASQAGAHLGASDSFTCAGKQSATLAALTSPANGTVAVDTTTGTITVNGNAVTGVQWGAPYSPTGSGTLARVAHVQSVTLNDGSKVNVTGNAALILLVDQDVTATGTGAAPTVISVAAKLATGGPGANSSTANGAGGAGAIGGNGGGGGAGHGAAGAAGGGGNGSTNGGGPAGSTYSIGANTETLEAGEAGGKGDINTAAGAGGGALQITACGKISLGAGVLINASGGGGAGGAAAIATPQAGNGGGGGGSGGTVLLEATSFAVGGSIASNGGGGGGGGGTSSGVAGKPGQDWDPTTAVTMPAQGGTNTGAVGTVGTGGSGAADSTAPVAGASASAKLGGGAGGGGAGNVFLNVPRGTAAPTVAAASPAIKTSTECVSTDAMCTYP